MSKVACHPEAYQLLRSYYLSPVKPPFAVSYRKMAEVAQTYGWAPIPSKTTLRRMLAADLPRPAQDASRTPSTRAWRRSQ